MTEPRIHATAEGFEAAAGVYDQARPAYPVEILAALEQQLDLRPGRTVLDLGAGTGKLTRPLVATGAEVIALEPVDGMRRQLAAALPEVTVLDATAEAIPLPDASVDAATAAQAFHWFDAARALPEIHRVLRPGGTFAVVLNRRSLDTPAQRILDEIRAPLRGSTPSWGDHAWERTLADPPGFTPRRGPSVRHHQRLDLDGAVARVASISFVAKLAPDEREQVLDDTRGRLAAIADAGVVTLTYDAEVTWLERTAP